MRLAATVDRVSVIAILTRYFESSNNITHSYRRLAERIAQLRVNALMSTGNACQRHCHVYAVMERTVKVIGQRWNGDASGQGPGQNEGS